MKAEVIKEFRGTPDNASSERGIAVGEIIFGDLAKEAVKAGNATPVKAEAKSPVKRPTAKKSGAKA